MIFSFVQGMVEGIQCFIVPVQVDAGDSLEVKGIGIRLIKRESPIEILGCFIIIVQECIGNTPVVIRLGMGRTQFSSLVKSTDRIGVVLELVVGKSQVIPGIRLMGVEGERLFQGRNRCIIVPGL